MVAIVTAFFNPCRWRSRELAYDRFYATTQAAGLTTYCVELCFGPQSYCRADQHFELAGADNMWVWQKEAMLQYGIQKAIADGHEYIAWADADILFPVNWAHVVETHVQPRQLWHGATRWRLHYTDKVFQKTTAVPGTAKRQGRDGVVYGGCWVAHRSFWETTPLFTDGILGTGDKCMFFGFMQATGRSTGSVASLNISRSAEQCWRTWQRKLSTDFVVRALPTNLSTAAHGDWRDRQYISRYKMLSRVNIPAALGRRDTDGLYYWKNPQQPEAASVRKYFMQRAEDKNLPRQYRRELRMGADNYCNLCDNQVSFQSFNGRAAAQCPICDSLERHRFVWHYLQTRTNIANTPRLRVHQQAVRAPTAVVFGRLPEVRFTENNVALSALNLPTGSVDVFYCSHVLDAERDEHKAISEICRVLRPGGIAVFQMAVVPRAMTYSNERAVTPKQRRAAYNSDARWRLYGELDLAPRLMLSDWDVKVVRASEFDADWLHRANIPSAELLVVAQKQVTGEIVAASASL